MQKNNYQECKTLYRPPGPLSGSGLGSSLIISSILRIVIAASVANLMKRRKLLLFKYIKKFVLNGFNFAHKRFKDTGFEVVSDLAVCQVKSEVLELAGFWIIAVLSGVMSDFELSNEFRSVFSSVGRQDSWDNGQCLSEFSNSDLIF